MVKGPRKKNKALAENQLNNAKLTTQSKYLQEFSRENGEQRAQKLEEKSR